MLKYAMQQLYHTIGILHWILFIDEIMIKFEINIDYDVGYYKKI